MSMTDPIADMLTRIRNGLAVRKEWVDMPVSKLKLSVADTLHKQGYISRFKTFEVDSKRYIRLYLKYGPEGQDVIVSIQRVSKPGRRVYQGYKELKPVVGGMGINIVSTPLGVMSDVECRKKHLGGEVLARVY